MNYKKEKFAVKKLLAAVLCIVLVMSALSPAVFAAEPINCEVYEISYSDGQCVISGRSFLGSGTVTLNAVSDSGFGTAAQSAVGTDGSFTLSFDADFKSYDVCISFGEKEIYSNSFDLSRLESLFEKRSNYGISAIAFGDRTFTLTGIHSGTAESIVTLQAVALGEQSGFSPDTIKAMADGKSDENGAYQIEFKVNPGDYTIYLKADGLQMDSFSFSCPDFTGKFSKTEDEFGYFLNKLDAMATNLEEKIAECKAENISTDYEEAYLEIIKRFIFYILREAEYNDYSRMGQYNYALTKIYTEGITNLDAYLNGEKEAYSVTKFKSDGISLDGVSVIGNTETKGIEETRPVFLTGYGIWDTVVEEIPFLSSIGHNFIQTEAFMDEILVPVRGGYWVENGRNDNGICKVTAKTTTEDTHSGGYALKVTNLDYPEHNVYRTLSQKFNTKANTTYVYGLWAKGNGILPEGTGQYASAWFNLNGIQSGIRCNITDSGEWQKYEFEYTTKPNETKLEFLLMFQDYIEELYIDDVYVYEKGTETNLLKNGDFDYYIDAPTVYDTEAEKNGWFINHGGLEELKAALERAEQYNVAVDIILNPAEMPDFIKYSETGITAAGSGYLPFALDNQKVRDSISVYARAVADAIDDFDSAVSLCLTNEPEVKAAYYEDYYNEKWHQYLKTVYNGDFRTLWNLYTKDNIKAYLWNDFSDVKMPTGIEQTRCFYDYINFNDSLLAEFHTWYANEVKKVSNIPVHSKTMQYIRENYENYYRQGTNYELVKDLFDINGCDAYSQYTTENSLSAKMAWYDMMTSLRERPVWNTEDHITESFEGQVVYTDIEPLYVAADVWNGALHGRGASAIWVLNDLDTMTALGVSSKHSSNNVLHKPEQMFETAKVSMDINRLSKEITALQKEKPRVGILYSRTSVALNTNHTLAVMNAYDAAIKSGQKVGFVTDTTYSDIPNYELLIVPEATNVSSDLLSAVQSYIADGGQVLLLGSGCLEKNESKQAHNSYVLDYIKNIADRQSTVQGKIQKMGLSEITLVDGDTGALAENIEWSYTKYDGGYIINVLNYDTVGSKDIKVKLLETEIGAVTDLRSGIKAEDGCITAKAMVPMLLKAEVCTFDLIDQNGNVIDANIDAVKTGKIRCTVADAEGTTVMALYKDGVCLEISTDGLLEVPQMTDADYRIMAAVWDMETLKPLVPCRNIFN